MQRYNNGQNAQPRIEDVELTVLCCGQQPREDGRSYERNAALHERTDQEPKGGFDLNGNGVVSVD